MRVIRGAVEIMSWFEHHLIFVYLVYSRHFIQVVLTFINLSFEIDIHSFIHSFNGTKWIEKLGCTSYRCLNVSSTLCGWITWICPSVFLFSCSQSRKCKGNANDDHLIRLELVYSASEVERWVGGMSPQHCHILWPQLFHIVMTVWHGTCRVQLFLPLFINNASLVLGICQGFISHWRVTLACFDIHSYWHLNFFNRIGYIIIFTLGKKDIPGQCSGTQLVLLACGFWCSSLPTLCLLLAEFCFTFFCGFSLPACALFS